jgi:DNA polymerase III epsilon subunit-like protein
MPVYISVDVETAGPSPSLHSLLSIGACTLLQPRKTFYVELKPVTDGALPEALAVSGLSLEALREHGTPPADAMARFAAWIDAVTPPGERPVFVAFNAPFDWMFVNDYFHRFLGRNPFGHSALDIKALYMGSAGVSWGETGWRSVASQYLQNRRLTHHALRDAVDQAEILLQILPHLEDTDPGQG